MAAEEQLEAEIRDLIQESRSLLQSGHVTKNVVNDLLARLGSCANQAARAGFVFSVGKLDGLAEALRQRLSVLE